MRLISTTPKCVGVILARDTFFVMNIAILKYMVHKRFAYKSLLMCMTNYLLQQNYAIPKSINQLSHLLLEII